MRQIRVYPYKMGSMGASKLAEGLRGAGLRCFKVFPDRRYRPRSTHTIINWGNSTYPAWMRGHLDKVLNKPQSVGQSSNKLTSFRAMKEVGVTIPEFTTDPEEARGWIFNDKATVVSRYKLQGHSGAGIEVDDNYDRFISKQRAPLYVKYIKKTAEYRVHVLNGEVIDIQMKRKKREIANEDVDYKVRNHANGWVYCRDNLNPDESVIRESLLAMAALDLDFGAVDIIWNQHYERSYVLEVNCAPGLEGTTLTKYVNAFKQL